MEILIPLCDMSTMMAGFSSRLERILFLMRISFLFSMSDLPVVCRRDGNGLDCILISFFFAKAAAGRPHFQAFGQEQEAGDQQDQANAGEDDQGRVVEQVAAAGIDHAAQGRQPRVQAQPEEIQA